MRSRFLPLVLVSLAGCGLRTGPIDGTYTFTAWTCGGHNVLTTLTAGTVTTIQFSLSGSGGSTKMAYSSQCLRDQSLVASYNGSSVTLTDSAPTCGSGCTDQCNSYPTGTSTFSYATSGSSLTLTRTLAQADIDANPYLGMSYANCAVGSTETRTMSK